MIRRRTFAFGAIALCAATSAQAQAPGRKYRIALFAATTELAQMTAQGRPQYAALHDELRRLGFIEDQNLSIARYSAYGMDEAHMTALARDVVATAPEVIFTNAFRTALALKSLTRTIPVVFNTADPVANGIVDSIARPSGNLTGTSTDPGVEFEGKRLQLLLELVPTARRIGYLTMRSLWDRAPLSAQARSDAQRAGVALVPMLLDLPVTEPAITRAYDQGLADRIDAVLLAGVTENYSFGTSIATVAAARRMPTIHWLADDVRQGALLSYAVDLSANYRIGARYIVRILNGEKPANLPIWLPDRYELAVNLRTAKALGLDVPPSVLIQAGEVIE